MGRPFLPAHERRVGDLNLRLTVEERARLNRLVERYGVTCSDFIRTIIELTARGDVHVPPSAFNRTL